MKFKQIIYATFISSFLFSGCSSLYDNESVVTTEFTNEETSTIFRGVEDENVKDVYENDIIKLEYNSDLITVFPINSDEIQNSLLVKLIDDDISNPSSVTDYTGINIVISDTFGKAVYPSYQVNYKTTFVTLFNSLLNIKELIESDVEGKPSTLVECDKILDNGNRIKAKFLHVSQEQLVIVCCNILPTTKDSDIKELIDVYNSIVYKGN